MTEDNVVQYIPMGQCQERHVYRIRCRNLKYGVYDGKGGFIGIRVKWGYEYLFTEYHWDTGEPYGTVHPKEDIGVLPDDLEVWDDKIDPDPEKKMMIHNDKLFDYMKKIEAG